MIEVILLEKIARLGDIGKIVKVKGGFARNFLLPRNKVLRATEANKKLFEEKRAQLELENQHKLQISQELASKVDQINISIAKQASDDGKLYGSVTTKEILTAIFDLTGQEIDPESIVLSSKIKEIGAYIVDIDLHADVKAKVNVSIIRHIEKMH